MIKKELVLQSFNKYKRDPHFGKIFYINTLGYFIQELAVIIKKPTKKSIEDLRLFQFEFEGINWDKEPESYLDGPIIDLFLSLDEDKIDKKGLKEFPFPCLQFQATTIPIRKSLKKKANFIVIFLKKIITVCRYPYLQRAGGLLN